MAGGKLTALEVTKAKTPGMYGDGAGLYLQVKGDGKERISKSWIFRYRLNGHTSKTGKPLAREMGLGSLETWNLSEARERARKMRQLIDEGKDPIEARKLQDQASALEKAKTTIFQDCAKAYIKAHRSGWKNAKHGEQWSATLETWAYPIIGKLPVGGITTDLVLKVLEQPVGGHPDAPTFWTARTETASRVRGRIENVLDWAKAKKLRDGDNPARWKGLLDKLLPAPSKVSPVEHHKALPYADLPRFMAELRRRDSLSARALEYTVLTAARTSDTIGAVRTEVDRAVTTWTVAAARLKGKKGARKRDHVVPLSDRALEILEKQPERSEYLFANEAGEPLSNMAMLELLQGMGFGEDLTVHGFRSTFKDWCTEQTGFPNEMSEMALAHTVSDKVEAAYRRGDMREKRRRMMADWADYCASPPVSDMSNVRPLRA
ncbi:tyrosine-type recombinase/integrase [Bradyrhizobium sp. UFLA05-112]